jgi:hypothetical protein
MTCQEFHQYLICFSLWILRNIFCTPEGFTLAVTSHGGWHFCGSVQSLQVTVSISLYTVISFSSKLSAIYNLQVEVLVLPQDMVSFSASITVQYE